MSDQEDYTELEVKDLTAAELIEVIQHLIEHFGFKVLRGDYSWNKGIKLVSK